MMMRSNLAKLMLLVGALALGGCQDQISELNEQALASLDKGDFQSAEESLKEAIRIDPTNRTLRRNLVEVYLREEHWDDAIQLLKSTLQIAGLGSDLELRTLLAQTYVMAGDNVMGSALVREVLEEDPENEYLLYLDGLTATSPKRAIESLEKAIELNPDRKESYLALAKAQSYDGDTEAALATLDRIAEKFGESVEIPLHRVSLFLRENDFQRAQAELDRAKEKYGEVPLARLYQGYLAVADRRTEEALEIFESLDGEEGVTQEARLGQSLCHLIQGDPNAAIEISEQILEEDESETVAMNLVGLGQLKRLQRFLAKQSLERSLENNPDQPTIQALVDQIGGK
ncbi:MAG: tetratricopeptide repeat protein [Candidatus Omnitrophica bacterium]|nr:tetratricopeptide repeat protein [Candidatus Omnitrophota bacterium]